MHVIDKPCGHSYAMSCECYSGVSWTTSGANGFLWNGPLQPRIGGGYEPAPLRMAKSLSPDDESHLIRGED